MMAMVGKYLATEMFEFNALSQFSIALFIYRGRWPCDLYQDQSIQSQGQTITRLINSALRPRLNIYGHMDFNKLPKVGYIALEFDQKSDKFITHKENRAVPLQLQCFQAQLVQHLIMYIKHSVRQCFTYSPVGLT